MLMLFQIGWLVRLWCITVGGRGSASRLELRSIGGLKMLPKMLPTQPKIAQKKGHFLSGRFSKLLINNRILVESGGIEPPA
jgi:hypothetical protein